MEIKSIFGSGYLWRILKETWSILVKDLLQLNTIKFSRDTLNESLPASIIFCDASKREYGFVAYEVQGDTIKYAKAKVAPTVKRYLPTLELQEVFLAIKCVSNILKVFNKFQFENFFRSVDSQIVFSGLLSDVNKIKTENIFARNRLKDIIN